MGQAVNIAFGEDDSSLPDHVRDLPESEPTTGTSQDIASTMTRPNCSFQFGWCSRRHDQQIELVICFRHRRGRDGAAKKNTIAHARFAACISRRVRSLPFPTICKRAFVCMRAKAAIKSATPFSGTRRPTNPITGTSSLRVWERPVEARIDAELWDDLQRSPVLLSPHTSAASWLPATAAGGQPVIDLLEQAERRRIVPIKVLPAEKNDLRGDLSVPEATHAASQN